MAKSSSNESTPKTKGNPLYKLARIEPLDLITSNNLNFLEGCVVKRVVRAHYKDVKGALEDWEKIHHEAELMMKWLRSVK